MEIRKVKISDAKGINDLLNSIIKEDIHWSVIKTTALKTREKWLKECVNKIKKGETIMYILEKKGEIIGMASAKRERDRRNHIWEIGYQIKENYRKTGLCTLLMTKLIESLKKNGAESLIAWTVSTNNGSMDILNKFDFKIAGRIRKGVKFSNKNYADYVLYQRMLE
ncbi:MAG: GNAT family N-acetyltransferase [Nanoarchaeota archaeon]